MITETDVELSDGRNVHVYRAGADDAPLVVFWHHGTPNTGEPPVPLLPAAAGRGIRWVSYDRPGYGRSAPRLGRDVASVAADVADVADALGVERFAVMGHSGGSPHALACAALLPERVRAVVAMCGLAPYGAEGLDWFAGMAAAGVAQLQAALGGREALEVHVATTEFDPEEFTPADHAALAGEWSWMGEIAWRAVQDGPRGQVDDNLAFVAPWGFDLARVVAPVLIVHGAQDRVVPGSHGEWLARRTPSAQLWQTPDDGHISILHAAESTLDWLRAHA